MAQLTTIRERARTMNSLACLLQGLVGHVTTVDLRNGSSVHGYVVDADSLMNLTMSDAVFYSPDGRTNMSFEEFYIQGRNVRYVHIPDAIDVIDTIKTQLGLMTRGKGGPAAPYSRQTKVKLETKEERKSRQRIMLQAKLDEMKRNLGMLTCKSEKEEPSSA